MSTCVTEHEKNLKACRTARGATEEDEEYSGLALKWDETRPLKGTPYIPEANEKILYRYCRHGLHTLTPNGCSVAHLSDNRGTPGNEEEKVSELPTGIDPVFYFQMREEIERAAKACGLVKCQHTPGPSDITPMPITS